MNIEFEKLLLIEAKLGREGSDLLRNPETVVSEDSFNIFYSFLEEKTFNSSPKVMVEKNEVSLSWTEGTVEYIVAFVNSGFINVYRWFETSGLDEDFPVYDLVTLLKVIS